MRLFGVTIKIDITVAILFVLLVPSLSHAFVEYCGADRIISWFFGCLSCALLVGSVLFHELAHVMVGRKLGVPFKKITLFVLGGMAKMNGKIPNAKAEFWMALAGPVSSLMLGVLGFLICRFIGFNPKTTNNSVWALFAFYLFINNVIMAGFNLIPCFPMDGGRMFRAIVWKICGGYNQATKIACAVGKVGVVGFVCIGILMLIGIQVPLFGSGLAGFIMLFVIALFIWLAIIGELNALKEI